MRKLFKGTAIVVGGIALSALLSFAVANAKTASRLSRKFETHRITLPPPGAADSAAIARGKHLVEARYGCNVCHGKNLGGGLMLDDPAVGTIRGPNLTPGKGSRTASFSMVDWDRIVRHGVKPDGSAALMPSEDFFKMSDAELSDIVAYVRSVPPINAEVPAPQLGPVGKILIALDKFPISAERLPDHAEPHPTEPPKTADSVQFGEHLAATCTSCHRANLAGGPMSFGPPSWPAAANLTQHASGLGAWSYEDFDRALTLGVSKDGRALRAPMTEVISGTKFMLPTERKALWTYLRSVAAAPTNP